MSTFLEAVRITDEGLAAQMDANENPTIAVMVERLGLDIDLVAAEVAGLTASAETQGQIIMAATACYVKGLWVGRTMSALEGSEPL